MNLSYKWLKELVDFDLSPEELGHKLTMAGLTIEEFEQNKTDTMMVAEVTTNRPDWLGHWGVAREIAGLLGKGVKRPEWTMLEEGPKVESLTSVEVEANDLCPRYTARVIEGVTIKESPDWLKEKIEAVGLRPINNVVDVTNFILMEMNQPLHAFDLDTLKGKRIIVRRAKDGEKMISIDGTECKLCNENLVIADAERAVAIAGVMGGSETEVSDKTVNILLESAYFEPRQVRRTSRALRLSSDSSYRFERGIDIGSVALAGERAAQLIVELAGGKLATGIIDSNPELGQPWELDMRLSRCAKILGFHIDAQNMERIFRGLGLDVIVRDASRIKVRVPSFRQDLKREIDLIEEVIRLEGYDKIPVDVKMPIERSHEPDFVFAARIAREALVGLGYHECFTDSFVPEKWLKEFQNQTPVEVLNPVNNRRPFMRTTLIPSLLEVRKVNRNEHDVSLFEINHVYNGMGNEPTKLAIIDDRGTEYVRGAFEAFMSTLRVENEMELVVEDTVAAFEPGSGASIKLGNEIIASFGILNAGQTKLHDLDEATAALEADLSIIAKLPRRTRLFKDLPRFPAIRRDIALIVPEEVKWQRISALVAEKPEMLEEIELQSVYRGKGIDAGMKSVAFSLTYRKEEGSLTDEEANALRDGLVMHLTANITGSSQRA